MLFNGKQVLIIKMLSISKNKIKRCWVGASKALMESTNLGMNINHRECLARYMDPINDFFFNFGKKIV